MSWLKLACLAALGLFNYGGLPCYGQTINISTDTILFANKIEINGTEIGSCFSLKEASTLFNSESYRTFKRKRKRKPRHARFSWRKSKTRTVTFDSLGISLGGKSLNNLRFMSINFRLNPKNTAESYPIGYFKGQLIINGIQIDLDKSVIDEEFKSQITETVNLIPSQKNFVKLPLRCTIDWIDPHSLDCEYVKSQLSLFINLTTGRLEGISVGFSASMH